MTTLDDLLKETTGEATDTDAFPDDRGPITDSPSTEARLLAVQALFQLDLMPEASIKEVKNEFLTIHIRNREADERVFNKIFEEGVVAKDKHAELIASCLTTNWTYDRLGRLEKCLLLAACSEFTARPDTPYKVIINEFVTLAKAFLDEKGSRLMNGLLNNIASKVRPNDYVVKK